MLIAIGVFIGVFAIIVAAYALFVVRPERKVIERLQPAATMTQTGVIKPDAEVTAPAEPNAPRPATPGWIASINRFLQQSGLRLKAGGFILLTAFVAGTVAAVAAILIRTPWLGLAIGALAGLLPWAVINHRRNSRLRQFEEQFPDAIDLVARALRAGHALTTGLGMVADEFKGPIGEEFRILYDEQNFGLTIQTAMRNFAERVPVLDARFFVTAVLTQREAGGNLAEVLDNLATVIRDRFRVKRQVHVISTHGRMTGWVLVLLPPTLAVLFMIISQNHMQTLVTDPLGIRMIFAAIALQIIGTLIIRRIINVEY